MTKKANTSKTRHMVKKTGKSKSRHLVKRADDTEVEVHDCGVGTSRSCLLSATQKASTQEDPRSTLGISTRADFRAVPDNVDYPLPRNCSETHLGFRSPNKTKDKDTAHFLPEIVSNFKPLSWDDRLDEFCGQNDLDDVEYVRHSKRGRSIAFTQYIGNNRPSHIPRFFSDGARQFNVPIRPPHHLPRLHSDGAIQRRGSGQQRSKVVKTELTKEHSVQHRSGGEFIENVRHATVQRKLDLERRDIQKRIRDSDEKATRLSMSGTVFRPMEATSPDALNPEHTLYSGPERPGPSTRDRVQEVMVEQDRLRKQTFLRNVSNYMNKHPKNK